MLIKKIEHNYEGSCEIRDQPVKMLKELEGNEVECGNKPFIIKTLRTY